VQAHRLHADQMIDQMAQLRAFIGQVIIINHQERFIVQRGGQFVDQGLDCGAGIAAAGQGGLDAGLIERGDGAKSGGQVAQEQRRIVTPARADT